MREGRGTEESVWNLGWDWAKPESARAATSAPRRAPAGGRAGGASGPRGGAGRGTGDPSLGPGTRAVALAQVQKTVCSREPRPALRRCARRAGPARGGLLPRPLLRPFRHLCRLRRRLRTALRPDGQGCAGEWRSERAAAWAGGPRPRLPPPRSWGSTSRRLPISGENPRPPRPALQPRLLCPGSPHPTRSAPRTQTPDLRKERAAWRWGLFPGRSPRIPRSRKSRLIAAAYPWCSQLLRHSLS